MDITEKGYTAVARGCRRLQVLRMYACAHVNDAALKACGQLLPDLRVIDICGAHLVTDDGAQVSCQCHVASTASVICACWVLFRHAVQSVGHVMFSIHASASGSICLQYVAASHDTTSIQQVSSLVVKNLNYGTCAGTCDLS